jgi:hydrogenase maturation protein HypF
VALSGGCFQNRLLAELASAELKAIGFEVLRHERIPCNDGGLALGQAAIASYRLATKSGS